MFNQASKRILFHIENLSFTFSLVGPPICILLLFYYLTMHGNLLLRILFTFYVIYVIYTYNTTIKKGKNGPGSSIINKIFLSKFMKSYLSVTLIKTADLSPNRNYIFAAFPHGLHCAGILFNFLSKYSNFGKLFPGIQAKVCAHSYFFFIPFYREIMLSLGSTSVSQSAVKAMLTSSNNSNGVNSNLSPVILVGGVKECIMSIPNINQVYLLKRKGFVRIAIITGTPLVPVYSFGETDLWRQSTTLKNFFQKYTNLDLPFFYGKAPFSDNIGIFPYRRPITTVVGAPIEVVKNSAPTSKEIDEIHKKFIDALVELFETHKEKYIPNGKNAKLIIS